MTASVALAIIALFYRTLLREDSNDGEHGARPRLAIAQHARIEGLHPDTD
ncbi:MAG: hypothetical protein ACRDN0_31410 [Trebonia sp.]